MILGEDISIEFQMPEWAPVMVSVRAIHVTTAAITNTNFSYVGRNSSYVPATVVAAVR